MDRLSIELKGSQVESIDYEQGVLRVRFSRAYLIKSMTGSRERTRWWQAGYLILEDAELAASPPSGPLVCAGGDIEENIYTYRDMIPIPLASRGQARCLLRFEGGGELDASGQSVRLDMDETPKYIEHIRPEASAPSA